MVHPFLIYSSNGQACLNNLLVNATFENNLTSWTGTGGSISTNNFYSGAKALQVCNSGSKIFQTVNGAALTTYKLTWYANTSGATSAQIGVKFLSGTFQVLGSQIINIAASNSFVAGELVKQSPVGTTKIEISIRNTATNCIWIDDLCLTSTTAPPPSPTSCAGNLFSNGDFAAGLSSWEGSSVEIGQSLGNQFAQLCLINSNFRQFKPAVAGQVYTATFDYTGLTNVAGFSVRIRFLDNNFQVLDEQLKYPILSSTNFTPYSISKLAPPNTAFVQLNFKKLISNGCLKVDNVCLTTVTSTNPCNPDVTPPTITCRPNIHKQVNGNAAYVTWEPPTPTDNCSVSTLTSNFSPGTGYPVGTTTVIYTAKDASNNTSTCSFTVNVYYNFVNIAISDLYIPSPLEAGKLNEFLLRYRNTGNRTGYIEKITVKLMQGTQIISTNNINIYQSLDAWIERTYSSSVFIPKDTPAGSYTLSLEMVTNDPNSNPDFYDVDLSDNTLSKTVQVAPFSGYPCNKTISNGQFECMEYNPDGTLQLIANENGIYKSFKIDSEGNLVGNPQIISPNLPNTIKIEGTNIVKRNPSGSIIYSKPLAPVLLNSYYSIEKVIEFGNGYIFAAYTNPPSLIDTFHNQFYLVMTDATQTSNRTAVVNSINKLDHLELLDPNRIFLAFYEYNVNEGNTRPRYIIYDSLFTNVWNLSNPNIFSHADKPIVTSFQFRKNICGQYEWNNDIKIINPNFQRIRTSKGYYSFDSYNFVPFFSTTQTLDLYDNEEKFETKTFDGFDQLGNYIFLSSELDKTSVYFGPSNNNYISAQLYPFEYAVKIGTNLFFINFQNGISLTNVNCDNNSSNVHTCTTNIAQNGSFENNLTNWSSNGGTVVSTNPISAGKSLQMCTLGAKVHQSHNAFGGYYYTLKWSNKAVNISSQIQASIKFLDANYQVVDQKSITIGASPSLTTTRTLSANAPDGATRIEISFKKNTAAGCVLIDDVCLTLNGSSLLIGSSSPNTQNVEEIEDFTVFPNPTDETLHIQLPKGGEKVQITLYNQLGLEMKAMQLESIGEQEIIDLSMSDVSNGHYYIKIQADGHRSRTKPVVVARLY